jgi:protein-S-isoprenylcysteine O-methyltransferase Ste14
MEKPILFIILSIPVILLSWKNLTDVKSHGFFRFFNWECILWLLVSNYKYWLTEPLSINQIIAWILLFIALFLVAFGIGMLKQSGKQKSDRDDKNLYSFEKTTKLVDTGIYKFIRHPMYSSLLFLTWGIFFKNTNLELLLVSIASSVFLYFTARSDEKECIKYFGREYEEYMKRSKRFIPYIF